MLERGRANRTEAGSPTQGPKRVGLTDAAQWQIGHWSNAPLRYRIWKTFSS
ncbi:hypothetical protein GCM10027440_08360 [Nocardiopsis coralliicola]